MDIVVPDGSRHNFLFLEKELISSVLTERRPAAKAAEEFSGAAAGKFSDEKGKRKSGTALYAVNRREDMVLRSFMANLLICKRDS